MGFLCHKWLLKPSYRIAVVQIPQDYTWKWRTNSTSEDKTPSAGVHVSTCNPQNLIFVWEQWNSSLIGILQYITRTEFILHYLLPPTQLFTLCARMSWFWYRNLPALFNSNGTKSKRSSGRTHCTHIYACMGCVKKSWFFSNTSLQKFHVN